MAEQDDTRRRAEPAADPFVALRRDLRRHDARWYWACRLRSFGPRALHALQYANIYAIGPVLPGHCGPAAAKRPTDGPAAP
jgi:hypothetical protein